MKTTQIQSVVIVAMGLVIALLLWKGCQMVQDKKESHNLHIAMNSDLDQYKNKYNQQVTKSMILQAEKVKHLKEVVTKDSQIVRLREIAVDYDRLKGKLYSATLAATATLDTGTTETVVKEPPSIPFVDTTGSSPVYSTSWTDKWSAGEIIASETGITRRITITNEYQFTSGYERQKGFKGLFKGKQPIITMKNLNPNTQTTELRTFHVRTRRKHVSVGAGVYAGWDFIRNEPSVIVGGGVQFNIINF